MTVISFVICQANGIRLIPQYVYVTTGISSVFIIHRNSRMLGNHKFFYTGRIEMFQPVVHGNAFTHTYFAINKAEIRSQARIKTFIVSVATKTILIHIVYSKSYITVFESLRERKVVILHQSRTEYLLCPIGVTRFYFDSVLVEIIFLQLGFFPISVHYTVRMSSVSVFIGLPINISPLVSIEHINTTGKSLGSEWHIKTHFHITFLSTLCGNDNDTVGGLRTIDRCRGRIFQHLNGFDIIGRNNWSDIVMCLNAIYHIKRGRIINGSNTAQLSIRVPPTGFTIGCYIHTGYTTLQARHHITCGNISHFFHLHHGYRTCQAGFLLSHITCHNHFINHLGILFHYYLQRRFCCNNHFFISYIT